MKAVAGGGGRGMRRVDDRSKLREAVETCMREAEGAFGDPTVFIEQAVAEPRHIEVQILADAEGNVIHLFERDCSVQRRHQKVIEIAPAPHLDPDLRDRICADAVRFAREIGYRNAGTVEFLVDPEGRHVFIEMNPRIQVEHTVTEEVTDVDLVQSQLRIAAGETLADLGLSQDNVDPARRRAAVPDHDRGPRQQLPSRHRQDHDVPLPRRAGRAPRRRYDVHRRGGLRALRLDARQAHLPRPDPRAGRREGPARGGGVPDPRRDDQHRVPAGRARGPGLRGRAGSPRRSSRPTRSYCRPAGRRDRGTKLLQLPRRRDGQPAARRGTGERRPAHQAPRGRTSTCRRRDGTRQLLLEVGPEEFARRLRAQDLVAVTDTTFRDAHQSLLATRVRTTDLLAVAGHVARITPELWSLECWGGATYDVALRFLGEDPWERLAALRQAVPNVCLQMLLRGRNTVGYTPYPTEVTDAFVAGGRGDRHRRVPDLRRPQRRRADAAGDRGGPRRPGPASPRWRSATPATSPTPTSGSTPSTTTSRWPSGSSTPGAHVLAIKDMAGLLRAPAARRLVTALRDRFDLPVHLHTHDTPGGQLGTLLAAIDAGVDAVDAACAAMAGTTSQPPLSALVSATDHPVSRAGRPACPWPRVNSLEPYWEATRRVYAPFESGLPSPTGRVYRHEIPGGQLSNLRQQAIALGLGEKFEQVEDMYAAANDILGNIVKVTPSSKVVGDLALRPGGRRRRPRRVRRRTPAKFDIPDSVIGFLNGELGDPPGGWPEPFRSRALEGRSWQAPTEELTDAQRDGLGRRLGRAAAVRSTSCCSPGPPRDFTEARETYGDVSVLPTLDYLYGLRQGEEHEVAIDEGKTLLLGLQAISEPDERGYRTVMATINGQLRPIAVRDTSVAADVAAAEKADTSEPGQVAAPFQGVVTITVAEGDTVAAGDTVATIEAMKMEASITAPVDGTVERLAIKGPQSVEGGDLVLVLG